MTHMGIKSMTRKGIDPITHTDIGHMTLMGIESGQLELE